MWLMMNAPNAISLPPPQSRWCPVVPHVPWSRPYRSHTTGSSNVLSQPGLMVFLWLLIVSQVEQPWPWGNDWKLPPHSISSIDDRTEHFLSFLCSFCGFSSNPMSSFFPKSLSAQPLINAVCFKWHRSSNTTLLSRDKKVKSLGEKVKIALTKSLMDFGEN